MANKTERDNQQVGMQTTTMRWRVCFTKMTGNNISGFEYSETFSTRDAAIKFGNDLGRVDFRLNYFGEPGTAAANIRIVEVGEYEKEVPWDEWCELSKSLDEVTHEPDVKKKDTEYQVWYTHTKGGDTKDVHVSFNNFVDARKEANRIRKQNRCYAFALARCGELKSNVRIQVVGTSSYIMEPSMWIVDEPFVVPEQYKDPDMTFEVVHSRLPKPSKAHDEASPMFATDKFTRFEDARRFAMHLVNCDGPAYVIDMSKTHWFFNIHIIAIKNGDRMLIPANEWRDESCVDTADFTGMLEYASEVAGIRGERDMLREELERVKREKESLKFTVQAALQQLSGHVTSSISMLQNIVGD